MIISILGILGGILVLIAYMGNTFKWLDDWQYQLINLWASLFAIVYLYDKCAYISVGLNVIWFIIAIISLVSILRKM